VTGARKYYVLYPYLRTKEPFEIGGITYKSSDAVGGESDEDQKHLNRLFKNFYLGHEVRIKRMVYASFTWTPDDEGTAQYLMASDSHRLLSYVVGSLLSSELVTAFALFSPASSEAAF
jgi:hypothetical protein